APSVLEGPEINGQNVTVLEHILLAGDAVDDDLVDRGADDGRVLGVDVAQEGRFGLALLETGGRDVVQLPGRTPRLGGPLEPVEHVGDDQVRLAQLRDLDGALELDGHPETPLAQQNRRVDATEDLVHVPGRVDPAN